MNDNKIEIYRSPNSKIDIKATTSRKNYGE